MYSSDNSELLSLFLEHGSRAVAMCDRDWRYLFVSRQWLTDFDLNDRNIIGCSHYEIFPNLLQKWQEVSQRSFAGIVEKNAEDCFIKSNGTVYWLKWEIRPCINPQNEVNQIIIEAEIISDRYLNKTPADIWENYSFSQAIFAGTSDVIFVKDMAGRYLTINSTAARIFNKFTEEIIGKNDWQLWPNEVANLITKTDREVIDTGLSVTLEEVIPAPDKIRTYLTTKSAYRDQQGNIRGLVVIARDITERKEAEEALRTNEERLKLALEATDDGLWDWDIASGEIYFNPKFIEMSGYDEGDLEGNIDSWISLLHPEDLPEVIAILNSHLEGRTSSYQAEFRMKKKSGEWQWVLDSGKVVARDDKGQPLRMTGTHKDITDRKQVEFALKQYQEHLEELVMERTRELSQLNQQLLEEIIERQQIESALGENESQFRAIFEQAAVGIANTDLNGKFVQVNQKFCEILGYTPSELRSLMFRDITHPLDISSDEQCVRQIIAGEINTFSLENRYIRKDGSMIWGYLTLSLVRDAMGNPKHIMGVVQDISDRKALEKELYLRQARFDAFFSSAPVGLVIWDDRVRYAQMNESLAEMTGLSVAEQLGKTMGEVVPELAPTVEPMLKKILATKEPVLNIEVSGETPKSPGIERHWIASYFPLLGEESKSIGVGAVIMEITARKQAEAKLREQATQLENALNELKRTQAQLIQSEKMSSLGQLVAGIAHEINNPVNFIYGNINHIRGYGEDLVKLLQLYQEFYPNPPEQILAEIEDIELSFLIEDMPKLLSSMRAGAERIRQIVISLRNFSRLDEADVKQVNIHEGLDSSLMILQNRLKAKPDHPEIQVIKNYGQLPLVECYAGQLNQVFMNILSNAIDALEMNMKMKNPAGREQLNFSHSERSLPQFMSMSDREYPKITIVTEMVNNFVKISITDNGPGIDRETVNKLFDPFFTTKAIGKGTGLGLSISYQIIVERHGGQLRCISQPGMGTEFAIEIPIKQK
ncbi:MAG TPA: PAS domain S-box protein [Leptolyngbyaceae cyanobacterium]